MLDRTATGMPRRYFRQIRGGLGSGLLLALFAVGCGAPSGEDADATYLAQRATFQSGTSTASLGVSSPSASEVGRSGTVPAENPTATVDNTGFGSTPEPGVTPTDGAPANTPIQMSSSSSEPVVISGLGTILSDPVRLHQGLSVVTMFHDGDGRFAVSVLDSSGRNLGELVSSQGPWMGSRAIVIPADGDYVAEVTADGDWRVEVMWPDLAKSIISPLPFQQAGTGSQAVYFIEVPPGTHTISATNDGPTLFRLAVIDSDGGNWQEVFSGNEPFDGADEITIEGDEPVFLMLDIQSDGNWAVQLE